MVQLAGFVYDSAGVALSTGITVNIYARNTVTPVVVSPTVNASGYWQATGVAEGRYDVEIVNGTTTRRIKYDDELQVQRVEAAVLQVRNPANTFIYDLVPGAITANRTLNIPVITATDTLAVLGLAQTFTANKTFNSTNLLVRNPADTFSYTLAGGAITADRTLNLPVLTGTDTLAVLSLAQTFTTGVKTFNSSILAIRNPADTFSYTVVASAITAARNLTVPLITADDTLAVLGLAQTFSAIKTFSAIPVMSGGAVGFPAAQVASAVANDLDDYEEGTWTFGLTFGGGSTGLTTDGTGTGGNYTKVGNRVNVTGHITLTNKGTSVGDAAITGLPFTIRNAQGSYSTPALFLNVITFNAFPMGLGAVNGTTIALYEITTGGVRTTLNDTDFANTSEIIINMTYETT